MIQTQLKICNKNGKTVLAKVGDLFFTGPPVGINNPEDMEGYLPIISLLTAIRQEDGKMWFYTLAADAGRHSIAEMDKDIITTLSHSGKTKIFNKEILIHALLNEFHDRNTTSIRVDKVAMYTTRIVISSTRISKMNFVRLNCRMADVSLWPIRAIELWARHHLTVAEYTVPKVLEDIEMRVELVQDIIYKHVFGKLARKHKKKMKKGKPAYRAPSNRIVRVDDMMYLNIHDHEIRDGKVMFQGPMYIEQVQYYTIVTVNGRADYIIVRPEDRADTFMKFYFTEDTIRCGLLCYSQRTHEVARQKKQILLAHGDESKLQIRIEDNPANRGITTAQPNQFIQMTDYGSLSGMPGTTAPSATLTMSTGNDNVAIGYQAMTQEVEVNNHSGEYTTDFPAFGDEPVLEEDPPIDERQVTAVRTEAAVLNRRRRELAEWRESCRIDPIEEETEESNAE